MTKKEQIEEYKRLINNAQKGIKVCEEELKKLEKIIKEVVFEHLTFRVQGVGVGIFKNGEKDMIDYLAYSLDGNQVKILRDFLNEKLEREGRY